MRLQSGFAYAVQHFFRQRRGTDFAFSGVGIFVVIIKKLMLRHNQNRRQGFRFSSAFQHAASGFPAPDQRLDQHFLPQSKQRVESLPEFGLVLNSVQVQA